MAEPKLYRNAPEALFPLGGLGAGAVSLSAEGRLCDWEIFNRPNKLTANGFTHFAARAQDDAGNVDARVLCGDQVRDITGEMHINAVRSAYGTGPNRGSMAGMKHFADVSMRAFYPIAQVEMTDPNFPARMTLMAFNPFIPMRADDSGLPAAFFRWTAENTSGRVQHLSLAFSCANPFSGAQCNRAFARENQTGAEMTTLSLTKEQAGYGNLTITTDAPHAYVQEYWYRGGWFDELTTFWREFESGTLRHRHYDAPRTNGQDTSTLVVELDLQPGQRQEVRFVLAWYVPMIEKYWDERKQLMPVYYSTKFADSKAVAAYALSRFDALWRDTETFRDAMLHQSLPCEVLDALQGNLALLKSSTCLRLEDGRFYGWEGVNREIGSCEGTCGHVWNYAYALPFLFPELERTLRRTEYTENFSPSGKVSFRTMLPLGEKPWSFRACVDGQMGGVIKFYRDWKICGDDDFLKAYWPMVKKSIEYAYSKENPDRWDENASGILTGRQHHTLDMELFGPSAWLEGLYLAALKAGAEMAEHLNDTETAAQFRKMLANGQAFTEKELFNGRHYIQKIDLTDKSILDSFDLGELINTSGYWNEEESQINYQIGQGCEIDQLLAAWHADLCGLGEIFNPAHRLTALKDMARLNFKSMREMSNPCRVFSMNDEKGIVMCVWDERDEKPAIPVPYTEETMTGFEYAAADNMLQMGMEAEALAAVRAIRERYDGIKRNPWSEIECGASYARAMASYSLLLTYSGFVFDLTKGKIGFHPLRDGVYFWSVGESYGTVEQARGTLTLRLLGGSLPLEQLETDVPVQQVRLNGAALEFTRDNAVLVLKHVLRAGDVLTLNV